MYDFEPHSSGPAPAYAYESDSEDDQWSHALDQKPVHGSLTVSSPTHASQNDFRWSSEPAHPPHRPLLVLLGHAGHLIASGLPSAPIAATLTLASKPYAYYLPATSTLCLPSSVPLDLQHPLASAVLRALQPGPITLVSAYPSPTYLPSWPASRSTPPPIRFLLTGPENHHLQDPLLNLGLRPFSAPNLIQGLDAALILQAEMIGVKSVTSFLLPTVSKTNVMGHTAVRAPVSEYDGAPGGSRSTSTPMLVNYHDVQVQALGKFLSNVIDQEWREGNGEDRVEDLFEKLDGLEVQESKNKDAVASSMYI